MSNRKIAPVEIDGKTIWIELEDIEVQQSAGVIGNSSDQQLPAMPDGAEPVGVGSYLREKATNITEELEAIVGMIGRGIEKVSPDEWSIELSIGFAAEKDIAIPYISAKGKGEGGIKVTAKWKKAS